jgi:hypothetical protein
MKQIICIKIIKTFSFINLINKNLSRDYNNSIEEIQATL